MEETYDGNREGFKRYCRRELPLHTPPLKTDENVSFAPPKHRCRELLYNTGLILTATKIWKLSPCTFHHLSLQVNIHILLAKWTRLSPSETNLASKAFGDPHHGS
jgi:hypothetical protein